MSFLGRRVRALSVAGFAALLAGAGAGVSGCKIMSETAKVPTVSLRIKGNVAEAQVTIDDISIGPMGYVAAHGVALPVGEHRVTVEHGGYFPWDRLVKAEKDPISLEVVMVPVPD